MEDALDVECEHAFESGFVEVRQGRAPRGTGVVHQNVERVLPRSYLVGQTPALGLGGEVGGNSDAGPPPRQLVGHLLADLRLARGDVDLHPGIHVALGDHLADAAAAAGDQGGLPRDVEEV